MIQSTKARAGLFLPLNISGVGGKKGKAGGERKGMNAMHVWEVVLAGFEINDLNMCYS